MTAIDILRSRRTANAGRIARELGLAIEDVYAELVAAEGLGMVRVVTHHCQGMCWCEWEYTGGAR